MHGSVIMVMMTWGQVEGHDELARKKGSTVYLNYSSRVRHQPEVGDRNARESKDAAIA